MEDIRTRLATLLCDAIAYLEYIRIDYQFDSGPSENPELWINGFNIIQELEILISDYIERTGIARKMPTGQFIWLVSDIHNDKLT